MQNIFLISLMWLIFFRSFLYREVLKAWKRSIIHGSLADITSNNISESDVCRQAASEAVPPICITIEKTAAEAKPMICSVLSEDAVSYSTNKKFKF